MDDQVILVDEHDWMIGVGGKLETHQSGKLHRSFSIFIFNSQAQLLLQKRARAKYHSGGLWSNTCCSHPRPGESIDIAAHRRIKEEMGFDCQLTEVFQFKYKVTLKNGLIEHEYDHVLIGGYDNPPTPNPEEFESWKWADQKWLASHMGQFPEEYTYWFKASFPRVLQYLQDKNIHGFTKNGS